MHAREHEWQRTKEQQHPPLARDAHGNLVELPKATCAWRIGRETTGRPRIILAPDNQPMRFPLHLTSEQLVEMCGPDVYHVYAVDEFGNILGRVTKVDLTRDVRELRNGFANDLAMTTGQRSMYAQTSDLRFALEAMAQMMRTNREALRAVTESQADWVKAIAIAKGLPRNAAYVPPAVRREEPDADEHDEDEAAVVEAPTNIYDVLTAAAQKLSETLPGLIAGKLLGGQGGALRNAAPASNGNAKANLAAAPDFEVRELIDLNYASKKAKAKKAAEEQQPVLPAAASPIAAKIAADPALALHLNAVKAQLDAVVVSTLIDAANNWSDEEQHDLLKAIKALPVDAAAEMCRELATTITNQRALAQAAVDEPAA